MQENYKKTQAAREQAGEDGDVRKIEGRITNY
jgi:hypothetical protein